MATIRPFRGLRYGPDAGPLDNLVAPPYDVLSQSQRDELASRSAHNVVHLTLPEQEPDDRSKFVKYARSASRLTGWRQQGALAVEPAPTFYRYRQNFNIPGKPETMERLALIALIKVEPYEKGVVLPHEQTFPKHKEDRLRILEATRSHLECIFGLYEDDERAVLDHVMNSNGESVADVTTDDGVRHRVEAISDSAATKSIQDAIATKKIWIADGHHRYETALAFRQMLGERDGEVAEDYMMMALTSMADPGLVLLPTHRILKRMPCDAAELRGRMSNHFQVEDCANDQLMPRLESLAADGKRAFGVALPGRQGFLAHFDPAVLAGQVHPEGSELLRELDVTILHDYIFEKLLDLTGLDFFDYTRDEQEAVDAVEAGAPAAFLMNPPSVNDMRHIALGGEKMPQKSTFYYPKILSGLVLWSLSDF